MEKLKQVTLNTLLTGLVLSSLVLSYEVWYSTDHWDSQRARDARIQTAPVSQEGRMPEVLRPERMIVRSKLGLTSVLQSGSNSYHYTWRRIQTILLGARPVGAPVPYEGKDPAETDSITLVMPTVMTQGEWAERWLWNTAGLRISDTPVDRLVFSLGQEAGIYLAGPAGRLYRLSSLNTNEVALIEGLIEGLGDKAFTKYRTLHAMESGPRVASSVAVPEVTEMPVGRVVVGNLDTKTEEARYFPDLSVIRQIDEKDARSYTDGQRLLRLTFAGMLEYRAASGPTLAPELPEALTQAEDWVVERGGWPQELVLVGYERQIGKTTLTFDFRSAGPYPVETASHALQIDLTGVEAGGSRVTYFRRFPDLRPSFADTMVPIMEPEAALQKAINQFGSLFADGLVRDVHLAYHLQLAQVRGQPEWMLDPVWVIQVNSSHIYVPASFRTPNRPFIAELPPL